MNKYIQSIRIALPLILFCLFQTCIVAFAQENVYEKRLAILGIPEETELLAKQITNQKQKIIQGITFIEGDLSGRKVVLARVGFGKVNAALAATLLIEHYDLEALIFTGNAGAINPDLNEGDIVIAAETTEHDFGKISNKSSDAQGGFIHWRTRNPLSDEKNPLYFKGDLRLRLAAESAGKLIRLEKVCSKCKEPKITTGVIVTGDVFVAEKSKKYELRTFFEADAVEMEGAAVAQICWQYGVPSLIVRSISDKADESALIDYYAFVEKAAKNSSLFVVETIRQLNLIGNPRPQPNGEQDWKIAFELAFGDGSPYQKEFPNLYDLEYNINLAITKEVLDKVVDIAAKETRVKVLKLLYSPGGYKNFPVVPSAQLEIKATERQARVVMDIIGYLAQQTTIIASQKTSGFGNRDAIEVIQESGNNLADASFVEKFWQRLGESHPRIQPGFSSITINGQPGIYIIDSEGDWLEKNSLTRELVINRLSKEFEIKTTYDQFKVEYVERSNNWNLYSEGDQYINRLNNENIAGLTLRLTNVYRENLKMWIKAAFDRHDTTKISNLKEKEFQITSRP